MTCDETFMDVCDDYEATGFKSYTDNFQKEREGIKHAFYQKKIVDKYRTLFFVNVRIYDLSILTKNLMGIIQELNVQFVLRTKGKNDDYVNITRNVNSPDEAIDKTQEMWEQLGADYYERIVP